MPSPLYSSNLSMECLVLGLFMFKPPELYCKSLEVSYCYCITVNFSLSLAPHSSTLAWKIPWTEEPGGAAVHGVAQNWTQLNDFTFTFHFHASEKEMATHSIVLALRIPGTTELSGLPSVESHRVRHN